MWVSQVRRQCLAPVGRMYGHAFLLVALILYGWFLWCAWFTYPNPYVDEAFFAPPALAFADHLDLHAPSLDPFRALHWMPVGHAVMAGLFVKLSGVSGLWGVRLFSSIAYGLALLVLGQASRQLSRLQALLVFMPFLMMPALTLSRMARMESLLYLMVLLVLYALLRRRPGVAIGMAVLSLLVHPNGAFAGLSVAACLLYQWRQVGFASVWRTVWQDWPCLLAAFVLLGGYAFYEFRHYDDFLADMGYQFARKARGFDWARPLNALSLLLISASVWAAWVSRRWSRFVLAAWGAGLMLSRLVGQEIWYSPGYTIGAMAVVASWFSPGLSKEHATPPVVSPGGLSRGGRITWLAAVVGLGAVFFCSVFVLGWHGGRLSLSDMRIGSGMADQEQVRAIAQGLAQRVRLPKRVPVSCIPLAECLVLWDQAESVGFDIRLNNPMTAPPVGEQCVWIRRANAAISTDADIRLDAGRIVNYAIDRCGVDWVQATSRPASSLPFVK